jgi:hypothetical protein
MSSHGWQSSDHPFPQCTQKSLCLASTGTAQVTSCRDWHSSDQSANSWNPRQTEDTVQIHSVPAFWNNQRRHLETSFIIC